VFAKLAPHAGKMMADAAATWKSVEETSYGLCQEFSNGAQFIALRTHDRTPTQVIVTLVHEAIHAAQNLMRTRGIGRGPDSDETESYLIDYIVEQCLERMVTR
jgi:hypothetical protein